MAKKMDLTSQVDEILKMAEARGVQNNYFFATTLKRYLVQLDILKKLEKAIKENGSLVTKTYVKGRENLVANPAITEYNKTATAANGTVATLMNIIKGFPQDEGGSNFADVMAGLLKASADEPVDE